MRGRDEYKASNANTGFGGDSCNCDYYVDKRYEMYAALYLNDRRTKSAQRRINSARKGHDDVALDGANYIPIDMLL